MTPQKLLERYLSDISRRNRFQFHFTKPQMELNNVSQLGERIIAYGRNFSIPSVSAEIHQQDLFNEKRTAVYKMVYDSFSLTLFDTKKLELHRFFLSWLHNKYDRKGNLRFYPDQYKTNAEIENHDNIIYKIEGLHPTTVGDFILSHDSIDELGTFDVTFSVDRLTDIG